MSEIIVGIDPSLTGLAVCTYYDNGEYGMQTFSSEPATTLEARLERYVYLARKAIDDIPKDCPVFLEGYSFGSRGSAVLTMAEFGGVFRFLLSRRAYVRAGSYFVDALGITEVPPTCLKKFVTGKGTADKTAMAMGAYKRWSVEFRTNDEVDAYSLARMGACVLGWEEPANDKQREAIASLRGEKPAKKKKAS